MEPAQIKDIQIVAAAMSLGPCMPKHVLEEIGEQVTPENTSMVTSVFERYGFAKHGGFWSNG